jgi:type VI secretion system protein ImpK
MALPLSLELFQSLTGGEDFFIRLHALRERPKAHLDVLEVYYLCMALGFKGKYFLEQEKLKLLIEDTYNEIRRAMEGREVAVLSPNGLRRDEAAPAVGKDIPLWVIGAGAATIAVIIFIILSVVMNNSAGDTINLLKQI